MPNELPARRFNQRHELSVSSDAECGGSPTSAGAPESGQDSPADAPARASQHTERTELKFVVPAMAYPAIRNEVRQFLERDPHLARAGDGRYVVRSQYFDTPHLDTYHARLDGHAYRTRLRLRRYETAGMPASDWFLEIKGKLNDVCIKTGRVVLPDALLRDHLRQYRTLNVKRLIEQDPSPFSAHLPQLWSCPLQPTLLIVYEREPFIHPLQPLRLTFDFNIRAVPTPDPYALVSPTRRILEMPVMEIKFVERVPAWLHAVIQKFQLQRVGVSKYCSGIDARWSASPEFEPHIPPGRAPAAGWRLPSFVRAHLGPENAAADA